jgi:hypothetical protein
MLPWASAVAAKRVMEKTVEARILERVDINEVFGYLEKRKNNRVTIEK